MSNADLTGDRRCWPCTVANTIVGLVVGWVPLVAALIEGRPGLVAGTVAWGVVVTTYTAYRLFALGYLPFSEQIAKWSGLHERIGPGQKGDDRHDR